MEYRSDTDREVVFVVKFGWFSKILIFLAVVLALAMPLLVQQLVNQLAI